MSKVYGRFDRIGGPDGMGHATNDEATRALLAVLRGELCAIPDPEGRLTEVEETVALLLRG